MNRIWTFIEEKPWMAERKYLVSLLILGTLAAAAGAAVWLIVRSWAFSTWDWLACFAGYPVILSWVAVFLYSGKHDFHDGKPH